MSRDFTPHWLWETAGRWVHPRRMPETLLLRLARERALSFAEIARRADPPTSQQQVERLAKGARALDAEWGLRLGPALAVAPQDLVEGRIKRVRLELAIASAFSEARPAQFELPPEEREWIEAPRGLERKEECFAALVADDSAAKLYPKGSILFVRRLPEAGASL
ncbi:MAG TPA: hypothetical protein VGR91_19825, partial [Stellaceae bacterium]|nr:hypothetical protein [Stellaceae bacterium]